MTPIDADTPRPGEQLSLLLRMPVDDDAMPPVQVRAHPRSRRLSVRIDVTGRVVVTTPRRTSAAAVERFIAEHREWIRRTWQAMRPRTGHAPPERVSLALTATTHLMHYRTDSRAREGWRRTGDAVEITTRDDSAPARRSVLRRWLLDEARREAPDRLRETARRIGLEPGRVQLRLQRTRWGSCSSAGTISLNACLLFLPPRLAEYLFVHELCHLRHMNHSRAYWRLVGSVLPDYRALDRALDDAWRSIPAWTLPE